MYIEKGIKFTGKIPTSPYTRSKRATAFLPYKIKYHEYDKFIIIIIITNVGVFSSFVKNYPKVVAV
jgi:hypothetical protein